MEARFDVGLLVMRLVVGGNMAYLHGYGKLQSFLNGATGFADPLGIGWKNSMIGAVSGEFVCGILLALGLLTRIASVGMMFTMFVAGFLVHRGWAWGPRELSVMYLVPALLIFMTGPGRFSFDRLVLPRLWARVRAGGKSRLAAKPKHA